MARRGVARRRAQSSAWPPAAHGSGPGGVTAARGRRQGEGGTGPGTPPPAGGRVTTAGEAPDCRIALDFDN